MSISLLRTSFLFLLFPSPHHHHHHHHHHTCTTLSVCRGQRHFVCSRNGLILHQKSPAEFTRGSITDEARLLYCSSPYFIFICSFLSSFYQCPPCLSRLEYQISLEVREPTPAGVFRRFSRPASEGPHLVELGQEVRV